MNAPSMQESEPPDPGTAPGKAAVDVWWCDATELNRAEIGSLAQMLPADQRFAAARLGNDDLRRRYVVAHAMTLDALGCCADPPERRLALARGPHGKPYVAGPRALRHLRFNLAHSGPMAIVAISADREVGIDIERIRPDIDIIGPARMCFTERELAALAQIPQADRVAAFFSCWTRKEALLKAQGTGLMRPPAEVEVGLGRHDPRNTGRPGTDTQAWFVAALDLGADYAGAVAVGGSEFEPSLRRWQPPCDRVLSALSA
jgi:4'-phosphopantetheinyl transferase